MELRAFADYKKGYSHTKNGTSCEDYAQYYVDPSGRYFICAVCDGHSDNNCFRSAEGARFGCESAIEVLSRFFDLVYEEGIGNVILDCLAEDRLKKSIKQSWDQKVRDDLKVNPIRDEELGLLSDRVRNYYLSGKGLLNIYGATFLAVAISEEYCITLHIGDGVMLLVNKDGTYFDPLEADEKSEMGSPASLCDSDLFSREHAFRSKISNAVPIAAVVSSDGIGDCMDQYQFMESIHGLLTKFGSLEAGDGLRQIINEEQQGYLNSLVEYYTKKGNGVEDDCSLAGIYMYNRAIPEVKLPLDIAKAMLEETVEERNKVVEDYERRKKDSIENLRDLQRKKACGGIKTILENAEKIENLKEVIRNIVKNEAEKIAYYDEKIKICEGYVNRAGGIRTMSITLAPVKPVNPLDIDADENYVAYKQANNEYQGVLKRKNAIQEKLDRINDAFNAVTKKMVDAASDDIRVEAEMERNNLDDNLRKLKSEQQKIEIELERTKKRVKFVVMKLENLRSPQPQSGLQPQKITQAQFQQRSDYIPSQRRMEQTPKQPLQGQLDRRTEQIPGQLLQSQSQGIWPFTRRNKKGGDET